LTVQVRRTLVADLSTPSLNGNIALPGAVGGGRPVGRDHP
jgi:hypothetical protein